MGSDQVTAPADVFALVSAMMALDSPVYFDVQRRLLSTDATFGAYLDAAPTTPLSVREIDPVWDFSANKGYLILHLENRSVVQFDVSSAGEATAWTLSIGVVDVVFDGITMKMVRDTGT